MRKDGQTNGRKDVTKVIGDFRDIPDAPKLIQKCTGDRMKGESHRSSVHLERIR